MSEAGEPGKTPPRDVSARIALAAAIAATVVCFGTLIAGVLITGQPAIFVYLMFIAGTWFAPVGIVAIGWVIYWSGYSTRRREGRAPVASVALTALIIQTLILAAIGALGVFLESALQAASR